MEFSITYDIMLIMLSQDIEMLRDVKNLKKKKNVNFLILKIDFVLANSVDPDAMPHYVASHPAPHHLPLCPSGGFQS